MIPEHRSGLFNVVLAILLILATAISARQTQFSPWALLEARNVRNIARFVTGLWPPEVSPEFLLNTLRLMLETTEISLVGTVLAVMLGFPLSILALREQGEEFSRPSQGTLAWGLRWAGYYSTRLALNLLRGIPELMWALIFVAAVGLGPLPGVLALAAHSAGILGKLYAEIFESVDPRLVEAVRSTGANELQVLFLVRLPASLPIFLSYTLFRWECNMRAATVLGLVGAGGIGSQLIISMKLFRYDEVMTLILAILALVVLVDLLGQTVRRRLLEGHSLI